MRNFVFLSVLLSFLFACEANEKVENEFVDEKSVSPTHVATFEVEGMMCKKGCGSAIRKSLYETGGVSEVEVTFNEGNPTNEIKVLFDIKKTSTEKMIFVIGDLAESRYSARLKKVTESTIAPMKVNNDSKPNKHKVQDIPTREVSSKSFSFPNLTKLLNGLIN
ncbi:heavy-metal-associated domain-containing protein [Brumimicrobium oceani]|uniref:Uncharacterized protein n=1 Tax=Brumimicrobium oceani TaxID=2100725 RepID=A0A2U2X0S4_9FLAO|nr:heavy metal-associated domain-containing protein [Brumimicrobium oceani]PWH81381.1 hypothetical protein DIT68_15245 [Brumimicrobium oceani]